MIQPINACEDPDNNHNTLSKQALNRNTYQALEMLGSKFKVCVHTGSRMGRVTDTCALSIAKNVVKVDPVKC